MKALTLLTGLAATVHSFPTAENLANLLRRESLSTLDLHSKLLDLKANAALIADPLAAPIDVSGKHAFQVPDLAKGDQRGPCPGLNALANHGYLPRNGVTGFFEAIEATNRVYGMGIDLSTVLAIMATVGVGNPLSLNPGFSIGGETPKSSNLLGNLLGLLGTPRGLSGSHNWIESDSSLSRNDLYQTGDATTLNLTLFTALHDSIPGPDDTGVLSMSDLFSHAARRFDESIATNPVFYYGPYTGMVARNAGYMFVGRLLSNHSAENPLGGAMTKKVLRSFWGVELKDGKLVYTPGSERIPENWYRLKGEYGLVPLNLDLVQMLLEYPRLASIGGNVGTVDSFAGVDLGDVLGGVGGLTGLLQGNNLLCFVLNVVKTFAPNSLSTVFKLLEVPLRLVNDVLLDPLLDLGCPAFGDLTVGGTDLWTGLMEYPGAKKAGAAL